MTNKIHYFFIAIGILMTSSVSATQTSKETQIMTQGLSHLGLTVSKLDQTTSFFTDTLGWRLAGEKPANQKNFCGNGAGEKAFGCRTVSGRGGS